MHDFHYYFQNESRENQGNTISWWTIRGNRNDSEVIEQVILSLLKFFSSSFFFGWQVRVFGLLAGTSSPYETTQHQLDSVIDRPLNGGAWMMNMWQLGEIDWLQLWVWFLFLALCPHHLTPSPRTRRCLGRAEGWQVAMRPANGSSRAADRKARAAAPKDWRTSS